MVSHSSAGYPASSQGDWAELRELREREREFWFQGLLRSRFRSSITISSICATKQAQSQKEVCVKVTKRDRDTGTGGPTIGGHQYD